MSAAQPASRPGAKHGPAPLQSIDGLAIYQTDYPPAEFVIDGLLPRGLTLAAGRPKIGKSWLTLQLAIAVALNKPALGRFAVAVPGRVTYLALEEPAERTHRRLTELVSTSDVRLQNIQFLYQVQPLMSGGAEQIDAFLAAHPSELVIVDTLLALVSAHTNRKDILRGDYLEVKALHQVAWNHKTAMLCACHSRKAAGDLIDTVLGTSGTTAATDSIWGLKRIENGTAEGLLEVVGRDFEGATYGLKFSNEAADFGWRVTAEGEDAALSQERRDILILLQQEGPKKPADIARLLQKNANTVRRLVQKLNLDGTIRRQQNGTYLPVNNVNVNSVNDVHVNGVNGMPM